MIFCSPKEGQKKIRSNGSSVHRFMKSNTYQRIDHITVLFKINTPVFPNIRRVGNFVLNSETKGSLAV